MGAKPPGGTPGGGGGSVWGCVSVTLALSVDGLTVRAAWIAVLAVAALAFLGWRKPARARPRTRRATAVDRTSAPLYRPPGPLRRLLAAVSSGGLAVLTGAVIAIVLAFAAAYAVITVTGLLGD